MDQDPACRWPPPSGWSDRRAPHWSRGAACSWSPSSLPALLRGFVVEQASRDRHPACAAGGIPQHVQAVPAAALIVPNNDVVVTWRQGDRVGGIPCRHALSVVVLHNG